MAEAVYTDKGRSVTTTIHSSHTEAFGAVRTASFQPTTGWTFAYNINAALINSDTDGVTGSVDHDANFAVLTTGTAADGYAQIQTKRGNRYIPGIGGLCRFTAIFTEGVADSTQYIGQIDDVDGWAFGYNGAQFGILRRAAGVDTWMPQTEWNGDKRADLDPTKGNVYQIEYRWLGFGAQFFSIEDQWGNVSLVHTILYSGLNTSTSVDNPNLPITARVENTDNTTNLTLKTPSAIAGLDGDPQNDANSLILSTDTSKAIGSAGTSIPIITLRNPSTWLGKNNRMYVQALRLTFATEGNKPVLFRVLADATITGGTYSDIVTNVSPIEVNTTFTAVTGGVQVGVYALGKSDGQAIDITGALFKGYPGEEITIVAATESSSTDVVAGVTFRQFL
jgi:hypothetical protein